MMKMSVCMDVRFEWTSVKFELCFLFAPLPMPQRNASAPNILHARARVCAQWQDDAGWRHKLRLKEEANGSPPRQPVVDYTHTHTQRLRAHTRAPDYDTRVARPRHRHRRCKHTLRRALWGNSRSV